MEVRPDVIPRQGTEVHLLSRLVGHTAPASRGGAGRVELVQRYTEVNTFYQAGHTNTVLLTHILIHSTHSTVQTHICTDILIHSTETHYC